VGLYKGPAGKEKFKAYISRSCKVTLPGNLLKLTKMRVGGQKPTRETRGNASKGRSSRKIVINSPTSNSSEDDIEIDFGDDADSISEVCRTESLISIL
jgi:hypothetical protein